MTARGVAAPLRLAACSIAAAFYSFLPTAYVGLSELGLIAGTGMIVAFLTTVTLLPALLSVHKPAGEPAPIGRSSRRPWCHRGARKASEEPVKSHEKADERLAKGCATR